MQKAFQPAEGSNDQPCRPGGGGGTAGKHDLHAEDFKEAEYLCYFVIA